MYFSTQCLPVFGYIIEEGTICPDPERLRPLRELSIPQNSKSTSRCLGLFSYYSQWIPRFLDRIRPIASYKTFPLPRPAVEGFESLKNMIENSVVTAIDETIPFEVETDASEVALAPTLSQRGKPVAFFSWTLQGSELKHASIEKEAQAIIEAVRHWGHFLTGRHLILKTDQKSVAYMFDKHHRGKIKNDKFLVGDWNSPASVLISSIALVEIMSQLTHFPGLCAPWRLNIPSSSFTRLFAIQAWPD